MRLYAAQAVSRHGRVVRDLLCDHAHGPLARVAKLADEELPEAGVERLLEHTVHIRSCVSPQLQVAEEVLQDE